MFKWTLTDKDGCERVKTTDNPTVLMEWLEEYTVLGRMDWDNIVIENLLDE